MVHASWPRRLHDLPQAITFSVLAACGMLVGCGRTEAVPYADLRWDVRGEVTVDGQPLAAGTIFFESDGAVKGVVASGVIADGNYEIARQNGPVAGANRVLIEAEGVQNVSTEGLSQVTINEHMHDAIDFDLAAAKPHRRTASFVRP